MLSARQELQQQFFAQGVQIDRVVVASGSSGTHGGLLSGFIGNNIHIPNTGGMPSLSAYEDVLLEGL
jgi:D-cysteine desulfhydrase